jgi:hypothetical protein
VEPLFVVYLFNKVWQAIQEGSDPLIWEHLGDVEVAQDKKLQAALAYATSLRRNSDQPKLKTKLAKLVSQFSTAEKAAFFTQRNRDDFRALVKLHGLAKIEACRGRACAEVQATIDYNQNGELRLEVPGPLSTPVFLVVASSGNVPQIGMIASSFQGTEPLVSSGVGLLNRLWRGLLFDAALAKASQASAESSLVRLEGPSDLLRFEDPSGRLRDVKEEGGVLTLSKEHTAQSPFIPLRYEFKDANGNILRMTLLKPAVEPRRFDPEE